MNFRSLFVRIGIAAGLCAFNFPFWPAITLYIFLLSIPAWRTTSSLSRLNFAFWALTGSLASVSPLTEAPVVLWPTGWLSTSLGFARFGFLTVSGISALFVVYWLLFQLHSRVRRLRWPVLTVGITYALTYLLMKRTEQAESYSLLTLGLFLSVSKVFWLICYQLSEVDLLKGRRFLDHFGALHGPWQNGWVSPSILRGINHQEQTQARTEEDFDELQVSACKLIFYAFALKVAADCLSDATAGAEWQNVLGTLKSTWSAWMLTLPHVFITLLYFAASTNAAVAVARACGFRAIRSVNAPYKARSFNDFLFRIYYHYIMIVQRFFFYPIWSRTRFLKSRRLRIFFVHFTALISCGGILTFQRRALELTALPIGEAATVLDNRYLYYLGLGLLSGLSAALISSRERESKVLTMLKALFFFVLYAICFSTQIGGFQEDHATRVADFLRLFGF